MQESVAAVAHCCAGRGNEAFRTLDALHGLRTRFGLRVEPLGQSLDLLNIENRRRWVRRAPQRAITGA